MRIILILITILNVVACANSHSDTLSIESEFNPYVARFVSLSQKTRNPVTISDLSVVFSDKLDTYILGQCLRQTNRTPIIMINSKLWPTLSQPSKEMLIFHELGHCRLNRDHDDSLVISQDQYSVHKSIMSTYALEGFFYARNYESLITELFEGDRGQPYVYFTGKDQFDYSFYKNPSANIDSIKLTSSTAEIDENGDITNFNCAE